MENTVQIADCDVAREPRTTRLTPRLSFRHFVQLNIIALVGVAVWFRVYELGNLPGVNGDEAWYGVQAELVLHGQPIDWRTPTGNLLNPLFFGPQLLLHAFVEPSFALLRTTAVVSGILALVANYCLCRRLFGGRLAAISTVILAVLSTNIVYSRLAWDASQSVLVTLATIYPALHAILDSQRRTRWSAVALIAQAVAIVVHPTNVFVAPVVGVCLATAWRDELRSVGRAVCAGVAKMTRGARRHVQRALLAFAIVCGLGLSALAIANSPRLQQASIRTFHPLDYTTFGANVLRLFSGATVYEYVSGAVAPPSDGTIRWDVTAFDLITGFVVVVAGWGLYRRLSFQRRRLKRVSRDAVADHLERQHPRFRVAIRALAAGWGLSLAAFFVIAGPAALGPNFERYGISLIGPGAILAAIGLDGWIAGCGGSRGRRFAITAALSVAWLLLASFQVEFFTFFHRTGGQSHPTFRTAAVEPKLAALNYIVSHSNGKVRIAASEWWNYWPLRYLAGEPGTIGGQDIQVEFSAAIDRWRAEKDVSAWQVEFTGSPACEEFRRVQHESGISVFETTINDYAGRPLLTLFRVDDAAGHWLGDDDQVLFGKPRQKD